jgi:hypothetical protein
MFNKALRSVSFQVALHTNPPPDIEVPSDPSEFPVEETIILGGMRQKHYSRSGCPLGVISGYRRSDLGCVHS